MFKDKRSLRALHPENSVSYSASNRAVNSSFDIISMLVTFGYIMLSEINVKCSVSQLYNSYDEICPKMCNALLHDYIIVKRNTV